MRRHRRHGGGLDLFRVTVALALSMSASHVATGIAPTCAAHCPTDCPMHTHGLGCHHGQAASDVQCACHHHVDTASGLHRPDCQQHSEGFVATDQPAVPVAVSNPVIVSASEFHCFGSSPPSKQVFLDPPFRPPATSGS